jgi:hypothetical protein
VSARVVSLRALLIEDCARTAYRAGLRSVARLLRREDAVEDDLADVCEDLRASASRDARAAGRALAQFRTGGGPYAAVDVLAEFCGLDREEWIAESCREQGVALADGAAS